MFRPDKFYPDQNIDLIADRAVSIDRAARKVSSPPAPRSITAIWCWRPARAIACSIFPTPISTDVRYLRTLDESEALRERIAPGQRVVVIGAGFIGLEFAATARAKGLEVDVVELGARVMARAVTAEISEYFQARHTAAGIRIHLGVQVTSIESDGSKVTGVSLSDGRHIPADLIVVGVGVLPNVELAAEAGLPVASGIIVDEHLLTSDPNISAIGDCALYASPRFGGSLRLESVQNATDHARCVAARLTGDAKTYDGLPWFWSDQGRDKLQMVGLTTGYDRVVVRGDRGAGSVLGVLLQGRAARRHRVRQPCRRSHVRTPPACRPRVDHAGAGGGYRLRPEERPDLSRICRGATACIRRSFRRRCRRKTRQEVSGSQFWGGYMSVWTRCLALIGAIIIAAWPLRGPASAQTKLKWAHVYEITEPYHTEALWAAERDQEAHQRQVRHPGVSGFPARQREPDQ